VAGHDEVNCGGDLCLVGDVAASVYRTQSHGRVLGSESATLVVDEDDYGAEPDEHLGRRLADAEPTATLEAAARCTCVADGPTIYPAGRPL
jgi:hypothetical protein